MPRTQKRCTFLHPLGEPSLSRHSSPEEQSLHHTHHEFPSASGLEESTSLGATRRGHPCTQFPGWQGAEDPAEQAPCKVLMIRRVLNTRHRATGWPSRSRVIRQLGKHPIHRGHWWEPLEVFSSSQMQTQCNRYSSHLGLSTMLPSILPASAHYPSPKPLPHL